MLFVVILPESYIHLEYFCILLYNTRVSTVVSTGDVLTWLKLGADQAVWNYDNILML